MLDFKFSRNLLGADRGDVGDRYEAGGRNQTTEVFRVPPAHFPNPEYPDSQLAHTVSLQKMRRSKLRLYKKRSLYRRCLQRLSAAARNIVLASWPLHERGGPPYPILTLRPQQSARPTTIHSQGRNRNSPSPRPRPRCEFVSSIQLRPQLAPRAFAPV